MMHFEQCWRWFGPYDTISLSDIKQTGASSIVTALHHIPNGEVWPVEEIQKRKRVIENNGLKWSVVESVPVHEDIKKREGNYATYINNYKESIHNLAKCGINTICYNFMPLTDWTRTDINYPLEDGSTTLRFDKIAFAAFELFILNRKGAKQEYNSAEKEKAKDYYNNLSSDEIKELTNTILLGLPGDEEDTTLDEFRQQLKQYQKIDTRKIRSNFYKFLEEVIPVAEKYEVNMAIHPDDPPFSLFGLPRVVSTERDIEKLLEVVDSPYNGLTFCTGSYGARNDNNLQKMIKKYGNRVNFIHFRSVKRDKDGSFQEARHLEGDTNMFQVMLTLIKEQQRRKKEGRKDINIPMRPDHGQRILDDLQRVSYPGYAMLGRLRGLAELRGLEMGIRNMLNLDT